MQYSFHNGGRIYFFKPNKPAYDVRDQVKRTSLEFHTALVLELDRPDVFILDDHGNMIVKSSKPVSHVPMAEWRSRFKGKNKNK